MNTINVSVDVIEIVQCIQTAANDIRLIYGKRTFVRAYLKATDLPMDQLVTGTLSCVCNGEIFEADCHVPMHFRVDHEKGPSRRRHWSESLNFEIPESFWAKFPTPNDGPVTVEFSIKSLSNNDNSLVLNQTSTSASGIFYRSPEFHCKTVGFRVYHPDLGGHLEPSPADIRIIREYVEATFPVAYTQCHWSSITVETAPSFEALQENLNYTRENNTTVERQLSTLLSQLLAIRNEDVLAGQDPRTLYIGVLPDPTARYGGIAMDSPEQVAPHVVSLCSVEASGELAAHELAHVLGRHHPGVPDIRQVGRPLGQYDEDENETAPVPDKGYTQDPGAVIDETRPDPNGYIAVERKKSTDNQDNGVMGLDARRSLSQPEILQGRQHFDLMTYRYPKWISGHTYENLYLRLSEFENFSPAAQSKNEAKNNLWTVIARYDLGEHSGEIEHVLKTNYQAPESKPESAHAPLPQTTISDFSRTHATVDENKTLRPPIQLEWDGQTGVSDSAGTKDKSRKSIVQPSRQEDLPVSNFFPNPESSDLSQLFGLIHHTVYAQKNNDNHGLPDFVKLRLNGVAISQFSTGRDHANEASADDPLSGDAFKAIIESINQSLRAEPPAPSYGDGSDGNSPQPRMARHDDAELITNFTHDDELQLLEPGIRLTWSASSGQSYFHFQWPRLREHVTTTVQCQRQPEKWWPEAARKADSKNEMTWETITVSDEQSGRVWIDPRFFGYPGHGDFRPRHDSSINIDERRNNGIRLRLFAHIGFERICVFNNTSNAAGDPNVLNQDLADQEIRHPENELITAETTVDGGLLKPVIQHTEHWLDEKRKQGVVMPRKFTVAPDS